jgi:hypothetical protein
MSESAAARGRERRTAAGTAVEIALAVAGAALVATALAANHAWLDRHFLPSFFMPRRWYLRIEDGVRVALAIAGFAMALPLRARVAGAVTRFPRTTIHVVLSALLALAAAEFTLRFVHLRPTEWLAADEEPRRQPDARLGWVLAPAHAGRSRIGGRTIEYAVDAGGCRVRRVDQPVDRERPTIVFAGESVMFGEGLDFDDTIPAQVGAMLGVQSANLAVHGYSNDQAFLRLRQDLPRFRRPVAVVALFMTALFGRNLDDDRPHLGPGLEWLPAQPASRLQSLAGLLVPYRRDTTVERGIQVTRETLRAVVQLAHARNTVALIVVPQFGPEDASDTALRRRVVADDVPSVVVTLDSGWRLPWDRHPNARAAHTIAEAVARRLQPHAQSPQG